MKKEIEKILVSLVITMFLFSCNQEAPQTTEGFSFYHDEVFTLATSGSELVNAPGPGVFSHLREIGGQDHLVLFNKKRSVIQKINLNTGVVVDLQLPNEGPFAVTTLTNCYWHNNDSIFVWTMNDLLIIDESGKVKSSLQFNPLGADIPSIVNKEIDIGIDYGSIRYYAGKMYLPLRHGLYQPKDFPDYYEGSILGEFHVLTRDFRPLNVSYPPQHSAYYGFSSSPTFAFSENAIWYSFGFSPMIYRYNLLTEEVEVIDATPYAGQQPPEPYLGVPGNPNEMVSHYTSQLNYSYLFPDEENRLIYRTAVVPGERKNQIKPIVLVYDFSGKIHFEYILPSYHALDGAFIRNGKLHIPYTKSEKENTIAYRLIYPKVGEG